MLDFHQLPKTTTGNFVLQQEHTTGSCRSPNAVREHPNGDPNPVRGSDAEHCCKEACNWPATATALRWSRRASLEWRRTKNEHSTKAISRISVTAAKPPLGTSSGLPLLVAMFGPVTTGVQNTVLEGPMLGEIHPTVVLVFPGVMAERRMVRASKTGCARVAILPQVETLVHPNGEGGAANGFYASSVRLEDKRRHLLLFPSRDFTDLVSCFWSWPLSVSFRGGAVPG